MKPPKKSLGQNFLIDNNIIRKITNLVSIKNKNIIEIGPGKGALTDEILKKKPKSLSLIEKDSFLSNQLKSKYLKDKIVKVFQSDILKFDIEKITTKDTIIFGNLPYNISSQILVKILKYKNWPPNYSDLIFMFQKELGEKIISEPKSKNYGRISILFDYRLKFVEKFQVSNNCFYPKPKVTSLVLHFKPKKKNSVEIKNISNLEKITQFFFSSRRKIISKKIKKILFNEQINQIKEIDLNMRPSDIKPETYFKITKLFETN